MFGFLVEGHICQVNNLVPRLPHVLNVARRERREPDKIYHMHDVGIEATWSAVCANHDSALYSSNHATVNDRQSECINDCPANKSPLLNVELTWATFGRMLVLEMISVLEFPERFVDQRWSVLVLCLANDGPR